MRKYSNPKQRPVSAAVRGDPGDIAAVRDMGFRLSSVFQYGLEFFKNYPEKAVAWEQARARARVREIWERGTRKGPKPP